MTATAPRTPGMRLSTVRDCPRRAVAETIGAPARDTTERERRIMWSGRRIGSDYLDMLEAAGNTGPIEREVKIPWELGVGHADAWLPEASTLLEILSSAHASEQMVHSKLLQLVLYMHHHEAEKGALLIVDPRDYSDTRIIVIKGTDRYDELRDEALDRLDQVKHWHTNGTMPGRVCSKPADAIGHFCRHAEWCFEGWTPPPLAVLDSGEAREAALRFEQAKLAEKRREAEYETAKQERLEAQAELAAQPLNDKETLVGPFKVTRIHYTGRRSFQLPMAEKDGRFPDDLLAEFTKVGEPYDVWRVERVEHGPALEGDDFGEDVPF